MLKRKVFHVANFSLKWQLDILMKHICDLEVQLKFAYISELLSPKTYYQFFTSRYSTHKGENTKSLALCISRNVSSWK